MYIIIITNKRGEDSSPGLPVHGGGGGGVLTVHACQLIIKKMRPF